MDPCQINGIDELKILQDVQHETNMKSIKNISIKKNTNESDHRTPKRKSDISNLNTVKKKKKYETALAAIFPENDQSYSQYAQDYAEGFMKKMRERLDPESLDLAIKLLASFGDADNSNINLLYRQITKLFTDKNEDLIYEFLGFLLPGQALSIGKFTDYLKLTRIKEFLRKLQVCMKKQPSQVRKILDNLFHLSKNDKITSLEVHTTMLPLLKSNPILVDCFFQLIPTERPPESFFSDDNWEDLDIDQCINYGIDYEEIIPLDLEDNTQLNVCHCTCHKLGDITHCRSCGLKFFKGRIYFDTPEGLKLAKINFDGADPTIVQSKIDKTEVNVTVKQKNRKSLTKNSSPGSAEDIKGSTGTESEEDLIEVKPKKRQKSKVVQSLKLKFKKEESPKSKYDIETCNEIGKAIVHVTNEELNSSEMVFFCIPKTESSVKIVPKKKSKQDIQESLLENECDITDQINSNITNLNSVKPIVSGINVIKTECNFIPSTVLVNTINNSPKEVKTESDFVPSATILSSTNIVSKENTKNHSVLIVDTVNDIPEEIKTDDYLIPSTSFNNDVWELNNQCQLNKPLKKVEITHRPLVTTSDSKSEKTTIVDTCIHNTELSKNNIKNEFNDQNISVDVTGNNSATTITSGKSKLLLDDSIGIKNEPIETSDSNGSTIATLLEINSNKPLSNENKTIKSEAIESLPPDNYVDVGKQNDSESEKHSNKWTIDEDKIILQTCKRVEDIEVLLETINMRIPQRSVSEIQERFTTLMTLLEQMIDVKQN